MMYTSKAEIGIDFGFGCQQTEPQERMRAIRAAGFDDVMLWWGKEHAATDGTPQELFASAQRAGLRVRTVHFPTDQTPELWRDGEAGDAYERQLLAAIGQCGEREIENLVVHTTKKLITPEPNEIGVRRVLRAAEAAEKFGVNLAWENTRFLRYNAYLYERVPSGRMRFCFDAGHANCFTPGEDPLGRFGSRMVTMHLHDNHGALAGDEHMLPGMGNINYARLLERLQALNPVCYNLEVRMTPAQIESGMPMEEFLALAYESLCPRLKKSA